MKVNCNDHIKISYNEYVEARFPTRPKSSKFRIIFLSEIKKVLPNIESNLQYYPIRRPFPVRGWYLHFIKIVIDHDMDFGDNPGVINDKKF